MASTLALLSTPSSPQSALELIDVCKRFGRDALALAPTNLTLNQGETVGLIGPNGAGKSTLLKIAAGVWSSDSGVVKYQGHPRRWPDSARLCGYAGQNTSLDPDMSGRELLRFFADLHGVTKARVCDDLIHDLGLIGQADKLIATWSGGMRRRLHVGIALLHQPPILILDEPTNGLDPDGREQLWSQLSPGRHPTRSVLIAGHDLAEMGRVCQRVAVMSQGAILAYDRPQQLIAQHGGYRLDVHLETPPSARVFTRIQALDEVQRATVRAARLTVTCHSQTGLDQVLGQLQQSPHEPLDLRRQAPGLASVYFNLTGHDAWQAGPPTRRRPQ